jgi:hypothetical protein
MQLLNGVDAHWWHAAAVSPTIPGEAVQPIPRSQWRIPSDDEDYYVMNDVSCAVKCL